MKKRSQRVPAIARAFLAAGGRIMVNPNGRLETGIDAALILLPAVKPHERTWRIEAVRAVISAERRHRPTLRALVAQNGVTRPNGWQVWEAGR